MEDIISSANGSAAQTGFRLDYLEVFNWGTFNEARWSIHPDGHNALLTGDIGSGKSTLVDALTCLLVPYNKIVFNKAAGAEGKERNLLSYVKGEYKKEKEEITKAAKKVYLRPNDNTYTVIIGNFCNKGYGENICLAQLFWIGKDSKVEKLLVIGNFPLTVKEHFSQFTDVNDLRKRLRNKEGIQLFNDNFTQYSEHFRRLFGMNSEKAIDLFYQTVSMKSVSSLTEFVREQMLERTDVKEQIAALLKRFEDLKKAHEAVVHAREQFQILKPLTEKCLDYGAVTTEIENVETMLEIAPVWFAGKKSALLQKAIEQAKSELNKLIGQQNSITLEIDSFEARKESILIDIANNGGRRIEQIGMEIKRHEQDKLTRKQSADEYDRLATQVDLKSVNNQEEFDDNVSIASKLQERCADLEKEYRENRDHFMSDYRKIETEYIAELSELKSLKERKTKIPAWLVDFRTKLCDDLRIVEEEIPFVGELLKIKNEEAEWEGAVEKLLHDAGVSLLVPSEHYRSISRYVNDNPLRSADGRGIKLTYLDGDIQKSTRAIKELDEDSIAYKVEIKPDTPFYDWLDNYLQRSFGDYICTDVSSLQRVSYGITKQGLIKSGKIRHTKDDRTRIDDRRNYVLGWSNQEKIRLLETAVHELENQLGEIKEGINGIEAEEKRNQVRKQVLNVLLYIRDYSQINWQHHMQKIHELENERSQLLNNNDVLSQLERNKSEVEQQLKHTKEIANQITEQVGGLKRSIDDYDEQLDTALNSQKLITVAAKERWFPVISQKQEEDQLNLKNIQGRQEDFRKQYQGENGELKRLNNRRMGLRSFIEQKMREIKEHSKAEYIEMAEDIDARAEYIKKFEQLNREDLKRHEERFKEQLNTNVINSISVFDNQLQKHENDIKQKIRSINQHLAEIVYNASQDTYIIILMDPADNGQVKNFKEDLKRCYSHSFSSNTELYTEEKYEQVKRILDRFSSMEYADKEWTNTVTDVRQWFQFNASERYRSDNTEKEFYEGSGGKSGGQKEKLAYTILASALAYQFGLQFGETKSRSFRFVVIDEAFGRGSDESTRYGLELFRKLDLQLLIVTPLQKIHVIENHVNSFHFVSNRDGNNSQVSNLTKHEYELRKKSHIANYQNAEVE